MATNCVMQPSEFSKLVKAIAESLGATIDQVPHEGWWDQYGHELSVRRIPIKITLAGSRVLVGVQAWPEYANGIGSSPNDFLPYDQRAKYKTPYITVSVKKSAKEIAKDIERRFMPQVIELWALCEAGVAENDKFNAERMEVANKVVEIFGGVVRGDVPYLNGRYGCTHFSNKTLTLVVRDLTLEEAAKIAEVIGVKK